MESAGVEFIAKNGGATASGSRSLKQKGNRNEKDIHRSCCGGYGGMSGAIIPVLLAVGVSVCVFVVAWWLVGKL
jgi:hypothetical protein